MQTVNSICMSLGNEITLDARYCPHSNLPFLQMGVDGKRPRSPGPMPSPTQQVKSKPIQPYLTQPTSISLHLRRKFYSGINVYPMHPLVGFNASCVVLNSFMIMIHWQVSIWVFSFIARMLTHQIATCLPSSAQLVYVPKLALLFLLPNQAANPLAILSSRMN